MTKSNPDIQKCKCANNFEDCLSCANSDHDEHCTPLTSDIHITCLSMDCPERKSICCGAISKAVSGDEGTGYFACSSCDKEFIGGKCKTATEKEDLPVNAYISKNKFTTKDKLTCEKHHRILIGKDGCVDCKDKGWEGRFNKYGSLESFIATVWNEGFHEYDKKEQRVKEIKSFISRLLQRQREEIKKGLFEVLSNNPHTGDAFEEGVNFLSTLGEDHK